MARTGMVELRVIDGGRDVLVYALDGTAEAAKMLSFLRDFFPDAQFVVQPLRH